MLSTGREFDRLFIGLLIITMTLLAIYTFKTCKTLQQSQVASANVLDQRVSYVTTQLSDTKQTVDNWVKEDEEYKHMMKKMESDAPTKESTPPSPEPLPYGF
jgi:hypothetical protein